MKRILQRTSTLLLFWILAATAWAQDRTVTGTVTEDNGSALPGVSVVVKGTTTGIISDAQGKYTLNIETEDVVLTFSFIGYVTLDVPVQGRSIVDVQLTTDARELNEIVVYAGIERQTRALGYSTTTVKADALNKARDRSALNSLQGKVAGARITSASGQVGAATGVILRGIASFNGNNQALIVVDGIPIDNTNVDNGVGLNSRSMGNRGNDINPADIESVTVLKGPAAAALYGSRAANGALIYTTKKGSSKSKAEVTVTSSYMAETILRVPKFQTTFGLGQLGNNLDYINDQETWGDPYDGSLRPYSQIVNNKQLYKRYSAAPGTVRDGMDVGHQFANDVSIGGGNATSNYYFSFSNLEHKGMVPGTYLDRQSYRLNGSTKLSNQFTISGAANYINTKSNTAEVGQGDAFWGQNLRISNDIPRDEMRNYKDTFWDSETFFTPFNDNPYKILGEWKNRQNLNRLIGNAAITYNPFDFLTVTYRLGGDIYSDERKFVTPIEQTGPPNSIARVGSYEETIFNVRDFTSDLIVTFNKDITSDINLNAMIGHNVRQRNTHELGAQLTELAIPGFENLANQVSAPQVGGAYNDRSLVGVYGSIGTSFRDFLFLEVTGRNDWSSTLPVESRSFFYPSVNAGFVFSELIDVEFVNFAKFRASYAEVGNDANPYLTASVYNASAAFPFGGFAGVTSNNNIGNAVLKPERTKGVEFGLEGRLANSRVGFDLAYYDQVSEDQIVPVQISSTAGSLTSVQNIGKIRNKGIELALNGTPVNTGGFRWDISLNFTKNQSEVEQISPGAERFLIFGFSGGEGANNIVAKVGQPWGIWEYTAILRDPDGNIIVDPVSGRPQQDPSALKTDGRSIQPDWTGGITNTFSYKNLVLSFLVETSQGGTFYNGTKQWIEVTGKTRDSGYNGRQPWIVPGSVLENVDGTFSPNTSVFVTDPNQYWNNRVAEMNFYDATWVKLREASLTYELPKKWLGKTPLGSVSVSVIGRNLLLFTPKENPYSDPELSSFGVDNAQGFDFRQIPSVRSFGGSIRATF
jgi:TonB-linked SusC/RagA family outer membrane protein